jgi:hypothetical protein
VRTPELGECVFAAGGYAYVGSSFQYAEDYEGLFIIDITNPASPTPLSGVPTPGGLAWDVALAGNLAYVADHGARLEVIDVTDPAAPQWIGGVATPGPAERVVVSGAHAFVADGASGVGVIEISDPQNPQTVGRFVTPGGPYDVAVAGSHLYAVGDGWLRIADIADPHAPSPLGGIDGFDCYRGVALAGTYAYVVGYEPYPPYHGLVVKVNVAVPSQPQIVDTAPLNGLPRSVKASGSFVYAGANGLQVVAGGNLDEVGAVELPGENYTYDLALSEGCAYLVNDSRFNGTMYVIDATNPWSPRLLGEAPMPASSYATGLAVSGSGVYVAALDAGLQVFPVQGVPEAVGEPVRSVGAPGPRIVPNPITTTGAIRLLNAEDGPVRVDIFDAEGRRIRTLARAIAPAGAAELSWDGRDQRGRRVAPGIYLVRLASRAGTASSRVAVSR